MDKKTADDRSSEHQWEFKPGDTVSPAVSNGVTDTAPNTPDPSPAAEPDKVADQDKSDVPPVPETPKTPDIPLSFQAETAVPPPPSHMDEPSITWNAAEFIAHDKSPLWYLALFGATVVLAAVVYLLTKDKISTAIVLAAGLAFGIYAARKPQEIQYLLDRTGIVIGQRHVAYNQFRSFSVLDEGSLSSLSLFPLKRFGQIATIYFDHEDEDAIVSLISQHLPLDEHRQDAVDRLMKRIHF